MGRRSRWNNWEEAARAREQKELRIKKSRDLYAKGQLPICGRNNFGLFWIENMPGLYAPALGGIECFDLELRDALQLVRLGDDEAFERMAQYCEANDIAQRDDDERYRGQAPGNEIPF